MHRPNASSRYMLVLEPSVRVGARARSLTPAPGIKGIDSSCPGFANVVQSEGRKKERRKKAVSSELRPELPAILVDHQQNGNALTTQRLADPLPGRFQRFGKDPCLANHRNEIRVGHP